MPTIDRRTFLGLSAGTLAALALRYPVHADSPLPALPTEEPGPGGGSGAPNVVVIIADDMDYGMGQFAMPKLRARMAAEPGWTEFSQAFVSQALCGPSRSTFLTGRYSHQHGVTRNTNRRNLDSTQTLATWLDDAGYAAGHIGKYLWGNNRHIPKDLPGWQLVKYGARSDSVAESAVSFMRDVAGQPFLLVLAGTDPHKPPRPPSRYRKTAVTMAPLPPKETDVSDKPPWLRKGGGGSGMAARLGAYRATLAIDDMINTVATELQALGEYDNTLLIFTSDHGYSWGSNRIGGKNAPYDPSVHVPLFVKAPGSAQPSRLSERVVSIVDLPATILATSGAQPTLTQMGRDLTPLLQGVESGWEDVAFIAGYEDRRRPKNSFIGLRTAEHTYVETDDGFIELYDLAADPYQHNNVAGQAAYADTQAALAARLQVEVGPTPRQGSLTVVKSVVDGGTGTPPELDWQFDGPLGLFALPPGGGEAVFDGLPVGDYTISESAPANYAVTASASTGAAGTDSLTVRLHPGRQVTVTFTNTRLYSVSVLNQQACEATGLIGTTPYTLAPGEQSAPAMVMPGPLTITAAGDCFAAEVHELTVVDDVVLTLGGDAPIP